MYVRTCRIVTLYVHAATPVHMHVTLHATLYVYMHVTCYPVRVHAV